MCCSINFYFFWNFCFEGRFLSVLRGGSYFSLYFDRVLCGQYWCRYTRLRAMIALLILKRQWKNCSTETRVFKESYSILLLSYLYLVDIGWWRRYTSKYWHAQFVPMAASGKSWENGRGKEREGYTNKPAYEVWWYINP